MNAINSFIVISDTHGLGYEVLNELLPVIDAFDALVHLGDGLSDLSSIRSRVKKPIISVRDNCDVSSPAEEDVFLNSPYGKILFTHGHTHRVKSGILDLALFAKERDCRYVFYGHTHVAAEDEHDGISLVNPGSLCRPRGFFSSYCTVFPEKGKLVTKIVDIVPQNR